MIVLFIGLCCTPEASATPVSIYQPLRLHFCIVAKQDIKANI